MSLPELNASKSSLEELEEGLKDAHREMQENSRGGAITALQAIVKFVNSIERLEVQSLALPLVHIMSALQDLDNGKIVPITMPTPGFDNRKPEAGMRKAERGIIIFFMGELIKAGMPVEDSAKFMVPILKKCGINIGGRTSTPEWRTLAEWRSYSKKRSDTDQETSIIREFGKECAFPSGSSLKLIKAEISKRLPIVLAYWNRGLRPADPGSRPE